MPARAKEEDLAEKKPEAEKFEQTKSLQELISSVNTDPLGYFERYPVKEVREACLKVMRDSFAYNEAINNRNARWAEECVKGLLQNCDREMAQKVLEWYIFVSYPRENTIAALKLALACTEPIRSDIYGPHSRIPANELSKMIAGQLKKNPWLYPLVPGLGDFFLESLKELEKRSVYCDPKYYDEQWRPVDRALQVISIVQDVSFLPILERLSALFKKGRLLPYEETNPLTKELHHAAINTVIKILKNKSRE